jgi:glycosyltransferase involved in cell wall biosynthesis
MRIVLIGPGFSPIPPTGWGAVESLVWDYYVNLKKLNHEVIIINTINMKKIICQTLNFNPDIIHIMYDEHINLASFFKNKKVYYTSHYAYITHKNFETKFSSYFNQIFKKVIENKDNIYINAISEEIKKKYIQHGFPEEKINVINNGAREDTFRFDEECKFPDKSIYIAKIEDRKRQFKYQSIEGIEFAGNFHNSSFNTNNSNYLGEWTKEMLYDRTTNYANLILLSDGEADPLVVKEGLMAGLGVVISECSAANLDREKEFIDVIPNEKIDDIEYIIDVIIKNREKSCKMRKEIRKYALDNFGWNKIIKKYFNILK